MVRPDGCRDLDAPARATPPTLDVQAPPRSPGREVGGDVAEASGRTTFPATDRVSPQLTVRAVLSGCLIGGLLSLCNIYAGLKIGWSFNMSITAMLVAFGVFRAFGRPIGLLENNINQTTASAAAYIASAGLVAPIPAFTILTGESLSYPVLVVWTASVSLVGVTVAIGLRRQMIEVDRLPFPLGVASAETIQQIYARGQEAMARVKMLLAGAAVGAGVKLLQHYAPLRPLGLPFSVPAREGGDVGRYTFANLTFSLDPSVLMLGIGAIIGLRSGASLLFGAAISWLWLAPVALDAGWAVIGTANPDAMWFGAINKWMVWPGVAMMVTASLTSFSFGWRSMVAAFSSSRAAGRTEDVVGSGLEYEVEKRAARRPAGALQPQREPQTLRDARARGDLRSRHDARTHSEARPRHDVPRGVLLGLLALALVLASFGQTAFFGVPVWLALGAVLFTFVLAVVAARVSGETGITPVGPMGKVTQLVFGVVSPGDVAGNLMAANVTGGAASQCGDLLHDLKAGALIGASPRDQAVAQGFAVLAVALAGCWGYLLLCPDPASMLLTNEWPAPAVAAWKAVAEVFRDGLQAMPPRAAEAMALAGALGIILALLEKLLPSRLAPWVPSPGSVGLAMVVPALYSISMFIGALVAFTVLKMRPGWARRFVIVLAAGLIAGESLVGVGLAISATVKGMAGG